MPCSSWSNRLSYVRCPSGQLSLNLISLLVVHNMPTRKVTISITLGGHLKLSYVQVTRLAPRSAQQVGTPKQTKNFVFQIFSVQSRPIGMQIYEERLTFSTNLTCMRCNISSLPTASLPCIFATYLTSGLPIMCS